MKISLFSPIYQNPILKYQVLEDTPVINVDGKLNKEEIIEDLSLLKMRSQLLK